MVRGAPRRLVNLDGAGRRDVRSGCGVVARYKAVRDYTRMMWMQERSPASLAFSIWLVYSETTPVDKLENFTSEMFLPNLGFPTEEGILLKP